MEQMAASMLKLTSPSGVDTKPLDNGRIRVGSGNMRGSSGGSEAAASVVALKPLGDVKEFDAVWRYPEGAGGREEKWGSADRALKSVKDPFRSSLNSREMGQGDNGYVYVPPAAAKYFLWDSTATGDCIKKDKAYPTYTRCIIRGTARTALSRYLRRLRPPFPSPSPSRSQSQSDERMSEGEKNNGEEDVAYGSYLVADRFDPGRRVGGVLEPSFTMPTDFVVETFEKEQSTNNPRNPTYPIAIHCSTSLFCQGPSYEIDAIPMELSLRHLVPDIRMEITPIHPLLLVPTALSASLLMESNSATEEHDVGVTSGYVTIDQSRHILPLSASDGKVFELPLIGIWVKNANNPKSAAVHSLCCQFISNSKLNKLDTGKSIMLLVLIPPNRRKALPCFYEESEYKFSLFGDGPLNSEAGKVDDTGESTENDDEKVLGFDFIYPLDEVGFCMGLEEKYNIHLQYKIMEAVKTVEPEKEDPTVSDGTQNETFEATDSQIRTESKKDAETEETKPSLSPSKDSDTSAASPASTHTLQYHPQHRAYLDLMERQLELWKTTMPSLPVQIMPGHPFPPFYGLMPHSSLYPPPIPYPFDLAPPSMRASVSAQEPTHPSSLNASTAPSLTSQVQTRSIGTNTSMVFETPRATTVDRAANTTFLTKHTMEPNTVIEKHDAFTEPTPSPELAPREPFTVATSCMAELEESIRQSKMDDHGPPLDTGSNYKPVYTYEPFEEVDIGEMPRERVNGEVAEKDTFDFSKELDMSKDDENENESWFRHGSDIPRTVFQPLLDISKIANSSFMERSLDTDLIIDAPKVDENEADIAFDQDRDVRERTMELIAKLADNPEKSFIFIEDKEAKEDKENATLERYSVLGGKSTARLLAAGREDRTVSGIFSRKTTERDSVLRDESGNSFNERGKVATISAHGHSRAFTNDPLSDEYSIGTLNYLRKYNLHSG
ncbi:hypothetical protein HDU67_006087 [Dinochytrium kinnereticum]|nr:hypothetical protein HDU67_006087 [Dinochytrium kinnereticum]